MINFNSSNDVSKLFFGGILEEFCDIPILNELGIQEVYKTGQKRWKLKTKKGIKIVKIKGLGLVPQDDWKTKKSGIYSTDEQVLEILSKGTGDAAKISKLMLKVRRLEKLLRTYYIGFEELIYPHDNCIHGSINHVQTDTGRTSSTKPNLQNIPR